MLKALKKRAVVCNIGHFDNEIDTAFMRKNWAWEEVKPQVHKIHRTGAGSFDPANDDYLILLAEGRLVNLGNATGHPSRIMDGSFANQVLAQIFLYEQKFADLSPEKKAERLTVEVLPKKLDEEVALEMVKGFGGVVTQLTKQAGRLHRRHRRRPVQAGHLPLLMHQEGGAATPRLLRVCKDQIYVARTSLQFRVLPHQDRGRSREADGRGPPAGRLQPGFLLLHLRCRWLDPRPHPQHRAAARWRCRRADRTAPVLRR